MQTGGSRVVFDGFGSLDRVLEFSRPYVVLLENLAQHAHTPTTARSAPGLSYYDWMSERRGGRVVAVEVMPKAEWGDVVGVARDEGGLDLPERVVSGLVEFRESKGRP